MLRILREQRGSVVVIVAFAMVCLLGFAALVVDVGQLYMTRAQLAAEADSSALGGAVKLPEGTSQALAAAQWYATSNGQPGDTVSTTIGGGNTSLTVNVSRTVNLLFAQVLGFVTKNVTASATATVTAVGSADGVVPFGVVWDNYVFGQQVKLKVGGGDGDTGNYGALALGGKGGKNYTENIQDGYEGTLSVGQWVTTETGNMAGPTDTGVDYRVKRDPDATYDTVRPDSPRVIVVPVLESFNVNGRGEVHIVGFATFFLEGSVKGEVTGRFVRTYSNKTSPGNGTNYGFFNIRLTQ